MFHIGHFYPIKCHYNCASNKSNNLSANALGNKALEAVKMTLKIYFNI